MAELSDVDLGVQISRGLIAKFGQAFLGFIGTIIFARVLGPTSFGGYYLLLSVVFILDRLLAGWGTAAKKRYSEVDAPKSEVLGATFLGIGISIVAITIVAIPFRTALVQYTGVDDSWFLLIIIFAAVSLFIPLQNLLIAEGRVSLEAWNDTLRSVLTLGFQLVLLAAGLGVAGMAYGLSAATVLCVPITLYYIGIRPVWPSRSTLRSIYEFAKFSVVSLSLAKAYDRFDVILLGVFFAPAFVGYYEVALKLTLPAVLLSSLAGDALMPKVSNLHSQQKNFAEDATNTLAFTSLFAVPILFGAFALSEVLVITIYGPEYRQAATYLILLTGFRFVQSQSSVLLNIIAGINRPDLSVRIGAVTLAVNIVLGIGLIFSIGPIGVVVATVVAESAKYVLTAIIVKRENSDITLVPRALIEQIISGTVMWLVILLIHNRLIQVASWHGLVLLVGLGGAVYFAMLLSVSTQFRHTATSISRRAFT